ncbi:hypothetical protein NQ317_018487 [Molorchus minor]|uniref:SOWAHA-C winged helix-turn-helix domain-containing protein n=1 Tax=Molorchus minor TaxID=1323400 RepID=A0ABQ9JWS4_9CUCU|nr:hypothetical protein NQ317_018487 [Molorchus minor]
MASSELTLEEIYSFLKEKGGKVRNRDAVRFFKAYLTNPQTKGSWGLAGSTQVLGCPCPVFSNPGRIFVYSRRSIHSCPPEVEGYCAYEIALANDYQKVVTLKMKTELNSKTFVNTLAHTKTEGDEKSAHFKNKVSPIFRAPLSPPGNYMISSPQKRSKKFHRPPPPPYRSPPPVCTPSPSASLDNVSLGSTLSLNDATPQVPPRKRDAEKARSVVEEKTPRKNSAEADSNADDKQTVSVKERTQKFNRMASVEDELSPRQMKSPDKEKSRTTAGIRENVGNLFGFRA